MALRLGSKAYVNMVCFLSVESTKSFKFSSSKFPFLSIQYNNSNFSVEKLHQVVLHNGYIYIEKANLCKVSKPSFILQ